MINFCCSVFSYNRKKKSDAPPEAAGKRRASSIDDTFSPEVVYLTWPGRKDKDAVLKKKREKYYLDYEGTSIGPFEKDIRESTPVLLTLYYTMGPMNYKLVLEKNHTTEEARKVGVEFVVPFFAGQPEHALFLQVSFYGSLNKEVLAQRNWES